jgi:hypothetical protein
MAKSTNKAKDFFAQRKTATPTATIVEKAAQKTTDKKPTTLQKLIEEKDNTPIIEKKTIQQASGEKNVPLPELPEDFSKFIMANNFISAAKINANIPIEIDNKLQLALMQIKNKYKLRHRQINKYILLTYIIDKALREDAIFSEL